MSSWGSQPFIDTSAPHWLKILVAAQRYGEALGGELEVVAVIGNTRVRLPGI
jgi:hypothetical protein